MPFPDIVWSALVIIGGLLLIGDGSHLSKAGRAGVMVILSGFLFQVYWSLLHQTEPAKCTWNLTSQIGVIYVTAMVVIMVLLVYPGLLRRRGKRG